MEAFLSRNNFHNVGFVKIKIYTWVSCNGCNFTLCSLAYRGREGHGTHMPGLSVNGIQWWGGVYTVEFMCK
jgi:hypothetical protein